MIRIILKNQWQVKENQIDIIEIDLEFCYVTKHLIFELSILGLEINIIIGG